MLFTLNRKKSTCCINILLTKVNKYLEDFFRKWLIKSSICAKITVAVYKYLPRNTEYMHKKCLVRSTVYRANLTWETLPSEYKDCSITISPLMGLLYRGSIVSTRQSCAAVQWEQPQWSFTVKNNKLIASVFFEIHQLCCNFSSNY